MKVPVNLSVKLVLEVTPENGQTIIPFTMRDAALSALTSLLLRERFRDALSTDIEGYLDGDFSVYQDYTEVTLNEVQP